MSVGVSLVQRSVGEAGRQRWISEPINMVHTYGFNELTHTLRPNERGKYYNSHRLFKSGRERIRKRITLILCDILYIRLYLLLLIARRRFFISFVQLPKSRKRKFFVKRETDINIFYFSSHKQIFFKHPERQNPKYSHVFPKYSLHTI